MIPAPVVAAQSAHSVQERNYIIVADSGTAMIFLRDPDDDFHHIREAAATPPSLSERMIDFRRHDELPGIGIEERDDRGLDLLFLDDIAVTDQHLGQINIWVFVSIAVSSRSSRS
jgi:hypothetical protein